MQKIIKQKLDGSESQANEEAQYTWEKDEIAYYFCRTFSDVFKIQFTGEHWLSGNRWGRNKIYKFRYLEGSSDEDFSRKGLYSDGVSWGSEDDFFTTKEEAILVGIKYISKVFSRAKDEFEKAYEKLSTYAELPRTLAVTDKVRYDNFGKDFGIGNEIYVIAQITEHGFMIGNKSTKPFFAYSYQIKLVE